MAPSKSKARAMFSAVLYNVDNKSIVYSSSEMVLNTSSERVKTALTTLAGDHVKFIGVKFAGGGDNDGVMFRTTQNEWFSLSKSALLCGDVPEKLFQRRLNAIFTTKVRKLMMHQKALKAHFKDHDWRKDSMKRPFLQMWDMGGGKTIGSLEATLGSDKPPRTVLIICAVAMIDYWADNVRLTALGAATNTFTTIIGYDKFKENPSVARTVDVVIVDECHTYKNMNVDMLASIKALQETRNLILLTGTPIVNGMDDLRGLMAIMGEDIDAAHSDADRTKGVIWTHEDGEDYIVSNSNTWDLKRVSSVMDGNVSFFSPKIHGAKDYKETYPRVECSVISVPCSVLHAVAYLARRNFLTLSGGKNGKRVRRTTGYANNYNKAQVMFLNDIDDTFGYSTKAREVASRIKRGVAKTPAVIYSAYLDMGVDIMTTELSSSSGGADISQRTLTGRTPVVERQQIVKQFNSKKLKVMQISAAGGTGINLLGAKTFFCMNACDNNETEAQVRGRVIRMDSHPGGHKELVQYFKVNAVFPEALKTIAGAMKISKDEKDTIREMYTDVFGPKLMQGMTDRCLMENVVFSITKEEGGLTIDEQLDRRNAMKQAHVDKVSNVLRDCSITMPVGSMKTGGVTFSRNMASLMATEDIKAALASGKAVIPPSRIQTIKKNSAEQWKTWNTSGLNQRTFSSLVTKAVDDVMKSHTQWLPEQPKKLVAKPEFLDALRGAVRKLVSSAPKATKPKAAKSAKEAKTGVKRTAKAKVKSASAKRKRKE